MADRLQQRPLNDQQIDERMRDILWERLRYDPAIDADDVTVSVESGRITLEGTVQSPRTRTDIEDVAEEIGVLDLQNNLRLAKSN